MAIKRRFGSGRWHLVRDNPVTPSHRQFRSPHSFRQSKKIMSASVYTSDEYRKTLYCGCNYTMDNEIRPLSCGYKARKNTKRGTRMEWDHIVPASYIGRGRACWEHGHADCVTRNNKPYRGGRCCQKVDDGFRRITADMRNLVPTVGELNGDRSNYPHREIHGEARRYGECDFEVDFKEKEVEPAIPLRGMIARTWLYMHRVHGISLTEQDFRVYRSWSEAFPAQQWEQERDRRINRALETTGSSK